MSWLGNVFGINPNGQGPGFTATGVNPGELAQAQGQAQAGIGQQGNFVNALQAQNGLLKQGDVYNQMQGTEGQLQNIAAGNGPNPALDQLAQTTQQNVAQQAALQAGQRGASANAGLIARQAAMQGGALQQQAAGQAATMRAQQQLAGIGALQSQQANLANLATTQVGQEASGIQGYNAAIQGNQGQLLGAQANQNTVNSGIAQANQKAGAGLIGGILGGSGSASLARGGMVQRLAPGGAVNVVQVPQGGGMDPNMGRSFAARYLSGEQPAQPAPAAPSDGGDPHRATGAALRTLAVRGFGSLFGGKGAPSGAVPSNIPSAQDWSDYAHNTGPNPTDQQTYMRYQNLPDAPAESEAAAGDTAAQGAEAAGDAAEGAEAAGAAAEGAEGAEDLLALLAKGGKVRHFDQGGRALPDYAYEGQASPQDPKGAISDILGDIMGHLAKGGRILKVPAMVSPGEQYLSPAKAKAVAEGKASPLSGKRIPGKAKVKGDSLKNDTVPAKLSPGGVVIPRSIMQSDDPAGKAAKFVAAVMARQTMKRRTA